MKKELTSIRVSAMNILAGREHSVTELRHKLRQKLTRKLERKLAKSDEPNRLDELIDAVIKQLINDRLLDEIRFTQSFIRSRTARGSGPVKIRHELLQRGISGEIIEEYLDDSYEFWQEHIARVRSKRFGDQCPQGYQEQSKQSRFLYQRGFSGELIQRIFNEFTE